MASYNLPSDATLSTGKAISQETIRALAANPIAIAEGAVGAPRIVAAGLDVQSKTLGATFNAENTKRISTTLPSGAVALYASPTSTGYNAIATNKVSAHIVNVKNDDPDRTTNVINIDVVTQDNAGNNYEWSGTAFINLFYIAATAA